MEKKQKDFISVLLLTVGVIFILVAGSIFVTTAWKYLPVLAKQLALLVVAGGMFGGSYLVSKNDKLAWISEALFHLGNAFVGFFMIAVTGGMFWADKEGNAFKIMLASCIMIIPVIVKLLIKKHSFDFVVMTLLADSVLFSGWVAFQGTIQIFMYLFAGVVMALAVADYMHQKSCAADDNFKLCVAIVYLVHAVIYTPFVLLCSIMPDDIGWDSLMYVAVIVTTTGISWIIRKEKGVRVCNSLSIFWLVIDTVFFALNMIGDTMDYSLAWLIIAILAALIMVCLNRVEMIVAVIAFAVVVPYGQLIFYWCDALLGLFEGVDKTWNTIYYPYSVVLGAAFILLYVIHYKHESNEWPESKIIRFAGMQLLIGMVMWFASKMIETWTMTFFLVSAMNIFMLAILFENATTKKVFTSIALTALVAAMFAQPFVPVPGDYIVEWFCLLITIGIVLFRFIWYDNRNELSVVYFAITCVLLGILLLANLISGGIGNVLILGSIGIVMLIFASVRNNKKYVIASSVTLILLVLYLTRDFWLSIAWWIYLFVAGLVLVFLAVKKAKES